MVTLVNNGQNGNDILYGTFLYSDLINFESETVKVEPSNYVIAPEHQQWYEEWLADRNSVSKELSGLDKLKKQFDEKYAHINLSENNRLQQAYNEAFFSSENRFEQLRGLKDLAYAVGNADLGIDSINQQFQFSILEFTVNNFNASDNHEMHRQAVRDYEYLGGLLKNDVSSDLSTENKDSVVEDENDKSAEFNPDDFEMQLVENRFGDTVFKMVNAEGQEIKDFLSEADCEKYYMDLANKLREVGGVETGWFYSPDNEYLFIDANQYAETREKFLNEFGSDAESADLRERYTPKVEGDADLDLQEDDLTDSGQVLSEHSNSGQVRAEYLESGSVIDGVADGTNVEISALEKSGYFEYHQAEGPTLVFTDGAEVEKLKAAEALGASMPQDELLALTLAGSTPLDIAVREIQDQSIEEKQELEEEQELQEKHELGEEQELQVNVEVNAAGIETRQTVTELNDGGTVTETVQTYNTAELRERGFSENGSPFKGDTPYNATVFEYTYPSGKEMVGIRVGKDDRFAGMSDVELFAEKNSSDLRSRNLETIGLLDQIHGELRKLGEADGSGSSGYQVTISAVGIATLYIPKEDFLDKADELAEMGIDVSALQEDIDLYATKQIAYNEFENDPEMQAAVAQFNAEDQTELEAVDGPATTHTVQNVIA